MGAGHGFALFGAFEQAGDVCLDGVAFCPDEEDGAGLDGFGAFGGVAHDEDGFAEAGGFFLYAAGVGEDEGGAVHERDEREVGQGFDEVDVGVCVGPEDAVDGLADVGVEVDGVDEVGFGVFFGEACDGLADVFKALAEAFAAVAGDEYDGRLAGDFGETGGFGGVPAYFIEGDIQGVDDGVSGDVYLVCGDIFVEEVLLCLGGGREVELCEPGGEDAVGFFGPGGLEVACAEAGFDMADGDVVVEGGECGAEDGGGVALDEDEVGPGLFEFFVDGGQGAGGEVGECLVGLHELEVALGLDIEDLEYLVEELAVLCGDADVWA